MAGLLHRLLDRARWEVREWRTPSRPSFVQEELDRALFEHVAWRPGEVVLDVGCAHGFYASRLSEFGCRVIGVDLDRRALRRAAESGSIVAAADGLRLPFREASFDALLCHKTAHLFVDPGSAAQEFARVTRPGGRIVLSISNAVSPYARVQAAALRLGGHRNGRYRNWQRGNRWPAERWSRAFAALGLRTRTVCSCNLVWPLVYRVCDDWIIPNEWMRRYNRAVRRWSGVPLRTDRPFGAAMDYVIEVGKP